MHLDISLTAVSTPAIAKQFAEMANVKSDFGGFLMPDAAVTMNLCSKLDKADIDQAVSMIQAARKKAAEGIDSDSSIPNEDGKKACKDVVGQLLDVAENTLKAGKLDGGAALALQPNSLTFGAGGFVKDGEALESAVKKLVALGGADRNFPSVKFDVETHKGVKMHSVAIPLNDDHAKKLFGDTLEAYLGIGDQSVYFALGKGGLPMLKTIIDKAGASAAANYPFQLNFALKPIMEFVNSTNPNPQVAMAANLLTGTPGNDHIRITP